MEQNTSGKPQASSPILEQSNSIQIAIRANTEALGTLLYDETQKRLALEARVRELEALNGLPPSESATRHFGLHTNRLEREQVESWIAVFWNEKQERGQLLNHLMSLSNEPAYVTQRDATVAATVIQWLASEGGASFLRDFNERTNGRFLKGVLGDE